MSLLVLQMLQLQDPVVDEVGFVYEKEAIYDWLSRQPGGGQQPVRAPIAGLACFLCSISASRAPDVTLLVMRHPSHLVPLIASWSCCLNAFFELHPDSTTIAGTCQDHFDILVSVQLCAILSPKAASRRHSRWCGLRSRSSVHRNHRLQRRTTCSTCKSSKYDGRRWPGNSLWQVFRDSTELWRSR